MGKKQKIKKSKKLCIGCKDNFYNSKESNTGECWAYDTAKIKYRKIVPLDQRPPWTQPGEDMLSCFHATGVVIVDGDRIN